MSELTQKATDLMDQFRFATRPQDVANIIAQTRDVFQQAFNPLIADALIDSTLSPNKARRLLQKVIQHDQGRTVVFQLPSV